MKTQETPLPPHDASSFTVAEMERSLEMEPDQPPKKEKKVREPPNPDKSREKVLAQMLKPPPVSILKENIRQQEKIKQEQEEKDKQVYLAKIRLYLERFPILTTRLPRLPQRASLAEIIEYSKLICDTLDQIGSVRNIVGYIDLGMAKLEEFMSYPTNMAKLPAPLQFNLKGMTTLFRQGKFPELDPIIAQLDIEYPWLGKRGLWMRTISAFTGIAMKVHLINTNPEMKKIFELDAKPSINLDIEPPE